ncbi:CAP domain-containing protein [Novosphingobium sp.]|uniref:CAP domain-containing protein n=1 Tax=Novosphingobium sp. TaxID=1874826 RepID=UPI003BAAFCE1
MPRIRALAIVAIAASVAAAPVAAQVTVTPTEAVAARLLAAHNAERERLGLKPLVWSAKLADHAKKWAQTLAVSNMFEHAPVGADGGEGENLWYGTKDDYSPEEMIGFFIEENKQFKRGVFPDVSTTGVWEDVGHYTQMVWKDTREVGCTVASNPVRDFLVCRYSPAGNVMGQPVFDYKRSAAAGASAAATDAVNPSAQKKRASKKRRRGG